MSKDLYILNIEHDLALANGSWNYIPPKVAQQMNKDMGMLPIWYAENGSATICDKSPREDILDQMDIHISTLHPSVLKGQETAYNIHPWGWDHRICHNMSSIVGDKFAKPDIEKIKELSHRRSSIEILEKFAAQGLFEKNKIPTEIKSLDNIREIVEQKKCLLKAPLSGSGRGLWWALNGFDFNVERWSNRTLKDQGSVIVEPVWAKKMDLAMEFKSDGKATKFAGYSYFVADSAGVYRNNMLMSDNKIEDTISAEIGKDTLRTIIDTLENHFTAKVSPHYSGYLGVDMLIGEEDNKPVINPCVEVNMRMTMGAVARLFFDKHVREDKTGEFRTVHFKNEGELKEHSTTMSKNNPLIIENQRICKGYLLLTSDDKYSHYGVEIEIN